MQIQQRLQKDVQLKKPYAYGPYDVVRGDKQALRITEGCVNNCPQCYEPTELKIFGIPEIKRNKVLIYDMNLLCKPQALQIIEDLGKIKVNDKVVFYWLVCGIDFRFLTQELANALHKNRFKKIRLAWDGSYQDQIRIKNAVWMLKKAGYVDCEIQVFMVVNYKVSFEDCCKKLDLCKVWGVQACDCIFDGQVMSKPVIAIHWKMSEIKKFRAMVRRHNQLVNLKIDPFALNGGKPSEVSR